MHLCLQLMLCLRWGRLVDCMWRCHTLRRWTLLPSIGVCLLQTAHQPIEAMGTHHVLQLQQSIISEYVCSSMCNDGRRRVGTARWKHLLQLPQRVHQLLTLQRCLLRLLRCGSSSGISRKASWCCVRLTTHVVPLAFSTCAWGWRWRCQHAATLAGCNTASWFCPRWPSGRHQSSPDC